MKTNDEKIRTISALPASKRYSHFIKVVADQGKAWGLFSDGWAIAETDDGKRAFALWPAKDFAERCALDEWADYEARDIDLHSLLGVLIPKLKESQTLAGVFPTPTEKGVTPDLEQLETDLRNELAKLE